MKAKVASSGFNGAELKRQFLDSFSLINAILPFLICFVALSFVFISTKSMSAVKTFFASGVFWPAYFFLVLASGTNAVSRSISQEVVSGTWITQRMTALSASDMWIGKYVGSTAQSFLSLLWLMSLYIWASEHSGFDIVVQGLLLLAFTAVVFALALGAGLLRVIYFTPSGFWEAALISTGAYFVCSAFRRLDGVTTWYGEHLNRNQVALLLVLFFGFWSAVACNRLFMKLLDYRVGSVGWVSFVLALWGLIAGFNSDLMPQFQSHRLWIGFGLFLVSAYGSGIIRPDFMRYRKLFQALRAKDIKAAYYLAPVWFYCITGAFALSLILSVRPGGYNYFYSLLVAQGASVSFNSLPFAFCLYCLRDIAIVMLLFWGFPRLHIGLAITLLGVFAYLFAPSVLLGNPLLVIFMPGGTTSTLLQIVVPLAELLVIGYFVRKVFIQHVQSLD